jgi:hypothetical protein
MKPDIHTLISQAERDQLYGKITIEFRRGVIAVIRTEKTQIFDNRTGERTDNERTR